MNYNEALNTLELKNGFTKKELKKAYFYKALIYHPDKNPKHANGIMFKKIKDSYDFLNDDSNKKEVNETYVDYVKEFLNFTHLNKDIIVAFYNEILNKSQELSLSLLDKLDGEQLMSIHDFIDKYNHLFNFQSSFVNKLKDEIKKKINVYILNPSIIDLLNGNVYKLDHVNSTYYIPLWQHELYYDSFIFKICPDLKENIMLDHDSNLYVKHSMSVTELFKSNQLEIILEDVSYEKNIKLIVEKDRICFKEFQILEVSNQKGVPKINEKDIFDISKRGKIYIQLYLHE